MEAVFTPATSSSPMTEMLLAWGSGDSNARDSLMELVYGELRRLASRKMAGEPGPHTLEPTALVHEAYLRIASQDRIEWRNRAQFYAVAAETMRRVLVDYARKKHTSKRGGQALRVALDDRHGSELSLPADRGATEIVLLDDALRALEKLDPRKSRMVELRYFAGLGIEETAAVLGVSPGTVMRDWTLARAWLKREMSKS